MKSINAKSVLKEAGKKPKEPKKPFTFRLDKDLVKAFRQHCARQKPKVKVARAIETFMRRALDTK